MNNNAYIAFTRQTVLNFRFFDANAMTAMATDLALSLTLRELILIRDHYRVREGRDPMVGELQLLSAYTARWKQSCASVAIACNDGNEETLRVLADMLRKRDTFGKKPATLNTLMNTATKYLARSGVTPHHSDLRCGTSAELAARAAGQAPTAALEVGTLSAMLTPPPIPTAPQAQMLLLLHPSGEEPFAEQIARLLTEHRALGLSAIATVGSEGVLPHLLALGRGFFLDLFPFTEQEPAKDLATVSSLGQGDLLLRAPEAALPHLFASGVPVTVCGALASGRAVQIRKGPDIYLSLSGEIFSALQSIRLLSVSAPSSTEQPLASTVTNAGDTLFGAVTTRGGCASSLLSLIGEMLREGADPDRMTMTALLEMPPLDPLGSALGAALPMVADLHRTVAELVLPCHAPRIKGFLAETAPTLTVFVCAERAEPRTKEQYSLWEKAAEQRDYAVLRRLLRPTL